LLETFFIFKLTLDMCFGFTMAPDRIRVCIIGAGASGLCAARHVIKAGLAPVVFEASSVVGGLWVYTDKVGKNVHSSIYKNLVTNLPKELMAFPDYPFSEAKTPGRSFLHHTEILEYLQGYARHFDLLRCIRFRTKVVLVKRKSMENRWEVTVETLDENTEKPYHRETLDFEGVMVCTGHYSLPKYPTIPGLNEFKGIQMHSHSYREPELFSGKTVLTMGAGASGQDITLEISKKAKKVYLTHRGKWFLSKLPNWEAIPNVASCVGGKSFSLCENKRTLDDVDVLFFATGYQHSYPFLDDSCKMSITASLVRPLFKRIINASYPTMCFIGIPFKVLPFPCFDRQVQFYVQSLTGNIKLPDSETMIKEEEELFKVHITKGEKLRYYNMLGHNQWKYFDDLARQGSFPPLPHSQDMEKIFKEVNMRRSTAIATYKQDYYGNWIEGSML
jgi:thioredoxin reductase